MAASDSPDSAATDIRWTDGALKRMERAPAFLRGMVRRLAEKKARELGYEEITEDILDRFKSQMMGGMGGAAGMAEAADAMAQGRLPWTAAAKERLKTVPEFMRGMIQQIAEEVAREGGHMEVNVDPSQLTAEADHVVALAREVSGEFRAGGSVAAQSIGVLLARAWARVTSGVCFLLACSWRTFS